MNFSLAVVLAPGNRNVARSFVQHVLVQHVLTNNVRNHASKKGINMNSPTINPGASQTKLADMINQTFTNKKRVFGLKPEQLFHCHCGIKNR